MVPLVIRRVSNGEERLYNRDEASYMVLTITRGIGVSWL